ncbi:MAG: hypothetical protein GY783_09645 [Gammaproteobacteria bacterium]|nr:hypothetical protein [Gammaproteobacteria bacterium]
MHNATAFQYRAPWRAVSCYPGSHPSIQGGGGYEVYATAPLYAGDPRRFDLRATLRDPFGQLRVRTFKQRSVVPVFVLADVSASMSFVGHASKFALMVEFVESLAYSAHLVGDPFSFTACDTVIHDELCLPPSRSRGAALRVCERLRQWAPSGAAAAGLLAGAERIPGSRALVFLVSDFLLPLPLLRKILSGLCGHSVVPVILVDSAESRVPGTGITHLYDPETRAQRTILLRRSWARRFNEKLGEYREQLGLCLAEFDLRPLYVIDRFEAEAVTRYFYE